MASRGRRLSGPARQLHQTVLAAFALAGQPPPAPELDRLARTGGGDPDRVRAELADADLLAFTAQGEIRAAYPFSPLAPPLRLTWVGAPDVHPMCPPPPLSLSPLPGP